MSTTYDEFGANTEALDVAKAFPDAIRGRNILVTGVNRGGIGYTTAQAFASQSPAHLILAGRNPSKINECVDELKKDYPTVNILVLQLNLSSQKSVRSAAKELLSWDNVIDIDLVVNNAAISHHQDRELNEDGIEMTFATNHIGHYLFTCLIMPKLQKAAQGKPKGATRIINVSSLSPLWAKMRWSDVNFEKINKDLPPDEQPPYDALENVWGMTGCEEMSYISFEAYNQSKVANVLFSIALNQRLYAKHGILSLSCHPGIIRTELSRNVPPQVLAKVREVIKAWPTKTLGAGASTSVTAALDPVLGLPATREDDGKENLGVYLIDCQISDKLNASSASSSEAEKLWTLSEQLVKESFSW